MCVPTIGAPVAPAPLPTTAPAPLPTTNVAGRSTPNDHGTGGNPTGTSSSVGNNNQGGDNDSDYQTTYGVPGQQMDQQAIENDRQYGPDGGSNTIIGYTPTRGPTLDPNRQSLQDAQDWVDSGGQTFGGFPTVGTGVSIGPMDFSNFDLGIDLDAINAALNDQAGLNTQTDQQAAENDAQNTGGDPGSGSGMPPVLLAPVSPTPATPPVSTPTILAPVDNLTQEPTDVENQTPPNTPTPVTDSIQSGNFGDGADGDNPFGYSNTGNPIVDPVINNAPLPNLGTGAPNDPLNPTSPVDTDGQNTGISEPMIDSIQSGNAGDDPGTFLTGNPVVDTPLNDLVDLNDFPNGVDSGLDYTPPTGGGTSTQVTGGDGDGGPSAPEGQERTVGTRADRDATGRLDDLLGDIQRRNRNRTLLGPLGLPGNVSNPLTLLGGSRQ